MNPYLPINKQNIDHLAVEVDWVKFDYPCHICGGVLFVRKLYDSLGEVEGIEAECDDCDYRFTHYEEEL